ncbi:MAG: flagellar protein FlgN [Methylococcales bacterium]|nr:flagellar protein FlgN [Methylococcales bacterium]
MIDKTFPLTERLFKQLLADSTAFLGELKQEQALLKPPVDTAKLDLVIQQKNQSLSQLNTGFGRLQQVLASERLSYNLESVASYLSKAAAAGFDTAQALELWQQIVRLSEQSQRLNDQNGIRIEALLRHNKQALSILKGQAGTAHSYGRDGATQNIPQSHTHFSA